MLSSRFLAGFILKRVVREGLFRGISFAQRRDGEKPWKYLLDRGKTSLMSWAWSSLMYLNNSKSQCGWSWVSEAYCWKWWRWRCRQEPGHGLCGSEISEWQSNGEGLFHLFLPRSHRWQYLNINTQKDRDNSKWIILMTHLEMFLQVMINVSLPIRSNSLQRSLWKMQCSETPAPGTPTHLTTQPAFIILLLFFVMCWDSLKEMVQLQVKLSA